MFPIKKKNRIKQYPEETMTDEDYADDLVVFKNAPTQIESLLHSLEQTTGGICLYMNTNKTKFIFSKQQRAIFTLNNKPLKFVD